MTISTGSPVAAADVNVLITIAENVYGVGHGNTGYGQTSPSQGLVVPSGIIGHTEWYNLVEIVTASATHQGTDISTLVPLANVGSGNVVTAFSTQAPSYNTYDLIQHVSNVQNNRLIAAANSVTLISNALTITRSNAWSASISATFLASFTNEDSARYFFNTGGNIKLSFVQPNVSSADDAIWQTVFSNVVGNIVLSANSCTNTGNTSISQNNIGFYNLSSGYYTTIAQGNSLGSSPYNTNDILVQAQVLNVAGINGGNGNAIQFAITLNDDRINPQDILSNGTTVNVSYQHATYLSNVPAPTFSTISGFTQDQPPFWITNSGLIGTVNAGSAFTFQLVAQDADSPNLSYSNIGVLPSGLTMNATGYISGTAPSVTSNSSYGFIANVTDGTYSVTRSFNIAVVTTGGSDSVTWVTPTGRLGTIYSYQTVSQQLVANSSNAYGLTYSLSSGSLPSNLILNSNGLISGNVAAVSSNTVTSFVVQANDGHASSTNAFSYLVANAGPITVQFTNTSNFTVPGGVNEVMFTWIVGGGGPGGIGNQTAYGGGGGGGGSGGYQRYQQVACNSGDIFQFVIGSGGAPSSSAISGTATGTSGGNTTVSKNSTLLFTATGGAAGEDAYINTTYTPPAATGGAGGSPNGVAGSPGQAGTNDYASSYGGAGAPGPVQGCVGGAGGIAGGGTGPGGPSGGSMGTGFGSGGGGAGSSDRASGIGYWYGGAGNAGFVEMTYPSQGATGGTPPLSTSPAWQTAAGTIYSGYDADVISIQLSATDPSAESITYAVTSGSLPASLTMSNSGLISGTLTANVATYNFTITATDTSSYSAARAFSIIINTPNVGGGGGGGGGGGHQNLD